MTIIIINVIRIAYENTNPICCELSRAGVTSAKNLSDLSKTYGKMN